jgi:hypothetical protein
MMANKRKRTMAKTDDRESIFICQGKYKYKILAATLLIRSNQPKPEPHDGEWKAIVTIYRTSNDEPSKAQPFHNDPQYGATEDEARSKGHDYGRKLVRGAIEGLNI